VFHLLADDKQTNNLQVLAESNLQSTIGFVPDSFNAETHIEHGIGNVIHLAIQQNDGTVQNIEYEVVDKDTGVKVLIE